MKRALTWTAALALLAGASIAAIKTADGVYNGAALNAAEKAAVQAGIDKLQAIANAEGNAQNKATMNRVIDCLKDMLKNGRICKETGTSTDEGTTEQDGKCDCKGDKMNVKATDLVAGEPQCSNLADTLMHEGIHTIQWAAPGSPYGGTEAKEEWVAYSWGKYILEKRLQDPGLTAAQKKKLREILKNDCRNRDRYCALADAENKKAAKGAGAERKRGLNFTYESTYPQSGRIDVVNDATGDLMGTLDTLFPLATGMAVFTDNLGREVLLVGACDANALNGVLIRFTDTNGDSIPDQSSRVVQTLGGGAVPLTMASMSNVLWALARAPGGVGPKFMYYIPDTSGDNIPDPLAAITFANSSSMPQFEDVQTFRVVSPQQIVGSARRPAMDVVSDRLTYFTLTDFNNDHIADNLAPTPYANLILPFPPLPMTRPSMFDVFIDVQAMPSSTVRISRTDAGGVPIEIIGLSLVSVNPIRTVPLTRPLNIGEYLIFEDLTNGLVSPTPFQVTAQIPEILGIDQTEVLPGQLVTLTTRFVDPPNTTVYCSGMPASILSASPGSVTFITPPAHQIPTGEVAVELASPLGTSNHVGLYINGDCNHNGQADIVDIGLGISLDVNGDGVPDECECTAYAVTQSNDGVIPVGGSDIGNHSDDLVTSGVALPFPFNYFGGVYNTINLSSNGNAQFTTASTAFTNAALPTATFTGPTIMPLWDDLHTGGVGEGIFTSVEGVAPSRIFHIVWKAHFFSGFSGTGTFELRLTEGSNDFDFVYGTVPSGGQSATIGCQAGGAAGASTQFSFNPSAPGPITPGLRLHVTQTIAITPATVSASISPSCVAPGGSFAITGNVTGSGCPTQTVTAVSANCLAIGAGVIPLSGSGTGPYTGTGIAGAVPTGTYTIPVTFASSDGPVVANVSLLIAGADDAGDTIASARVMTGGAITSISGMILDSACGTNDADVYKIGICAPTSFSASTVGGATYDTQLFLFNKLGVGVAVNDDEVAGTSLQSRLTNAFTTSLAPGNYYLAISRYNKDPVDTSNALIFLSAPTRSERGPDGPSVSHIFDHWDSGQLSGGGPYTIALTGVCGVLPECHGTCVADVDDGTFTGTPDGGVTIDDLLYYLFIFDQGLLCADVDDGSFTGTPDGGVTIDDLLYYLFRFDAGC